MSVVVGVDPGESSGMVVLDDGRLVLIMQGTPELLLRTLRVVVAAAVEGRHAIEVVCERFIERKGPGVHLAHQPAALEVTGAVRDTCVAAGIRFTLQNAADAKALAPNHVLRMLDLLPMPADVDAADADDARDAMRHALLRLATRYATVFDRLLRDAGAPTS